MVRALIIVSLLLAQLGSSVHAQTAGEEALLRTLHETRVDVDYVAMDFDRIIEDLRTTHGLNIQVSWKLLESLGIRRDTRLEVRLNDVSLATLLSNVLREADPSNYHELDYQIEGGVIVISTRDALSQNTLLRAYDVTDLIDSGYADRRFFSTPALSLALTGNEALGGEDLQTLRDEKVGGAMGGGGFGGGGSGGGGDMFEERDIYRTSSMERLEDLIEIITESVSPDEWENNGGLVATVRAHGSTLLIRHTINGHQRVESFLNLLRAQRPASLDADVLVVRLRRDRVAALRQEIGAYFPRLSADQFAALASSLAEGESIFRGTSSGYNGRRIWFSALTQRDLLMDVNAEAADSINAFSPVTGYATEGLELIALPLLSPDRSRLDLDVQMAWIPGLAVTERSIVLAPGAEAATIDQLARSMRTVSTTVTLGLGEAIALSIPHQLDRPAEGGDWEEWLIVQVREAGGGGQ